MQRRNIFSRIKKFIKQIFNEDPALTKLKGDLMMECDIPDSLTCPILQDIPDDLIVTPYGHVFSYGRLETWLKENETCPLTRKDLSVTDFIIDTELCFIAGPIKEELIKTVKAINKMSLLDEGKIRDRIETFNAHSVIAEQEAAERLAVIIQAGLIQELKNRLMLDINNPEHLHYWQMHTNEMFDICCSVLDYRGESYRIPVDIYDLMKISNKEHQSKNNFKEAIDFRRDEGLTTPSICPNPYAFFVAKVIRSPAGLEIYNADDLEKVDLGLNP